jgi:hypothetical protein
VIGMTDQTGNQQGGHAFVRPGQVAPDRPAPDQCVECGGPLATHALRAVLEALDIPHPATVGDGEVHDRILGDRVRHTVVFLRALLADLTEDFDRPEWGLKYFREKLAEHPATGYRTWDEAVAELHAREAVQEEPPARCGSPATCAEFAREHPHIDDAVDGPAAARLADSPAFNQLTAHQLGEVSGPEAGQ